MTTDYSELEAKVLARKKRTLYRYVDSYWTPDKKPMLVELEIVRKTKCGYWVREIRRGQFAVHLDFKPERWMSKKGRYARTDQRRALDDFKRRKGV